MLYPIKNVLSTAFCYAKCSKRMEYLTCFGMENSLTLPSLANKYFKSLRDENDEPFYSYNDECMRYFVWKSKKGGRCAALNFFLRNWMLSVMFVTF